jgi:hypothetical protein
MAPEHKQVLVAHWQQLRKDFQIHGPALLAI